MDYHVFKHPYILVEDETGRHRPFFREFRSESKEAATSWAEKGAETRTNQKKDKPGKRIGVCEICVARFSDYQEHITDNTHLKIASSTVCYDEVDAIIKEISMETEKRKEKRARKKLFG